MGQVTALERPCSDHSAATASSARRRLRPSRARSGGGCPGPAPCRWGERRHDNRGRSGVDRVCYRSRDLPFTERGSTVPTFGRAPCSYGRWGSRRQSRRALPRRRGRRLRAARPPLPAACSSTSPCACSATARTPATSCRRRSSRPTRSWRRFDPQLPLLQLDVPHRAERVPERAQPAPPGGPARRSSRSPPGGPEEALHERERAGRRAGGAAAPGGRRPPGAGPAALRRAELRGDRRGAGRRREDRQVAAPRGPPAARAAAGAGELVDERESGTSSTGTRHDEPSAPWRAAERSGPAAPAWRRGGRGRRAGERGAPGLQLSRGSTV